MKKNKILLVRPLKKEIDLSNKCYILLNNWASYQNKKIKNKIISTYFLNEDLIKKRLKEISKNYNSMILLLAAELNKAHNTSFSVRYWEILLGPWLFRFLCIFSYNFYNLKTVLKRNPKIKIEIIDNDNFNFTTFETGGIFDATKNLNWFYNLNSLIIKHINPSNKVKRFISKTRFNDNGNHSHFFKIKENIYKNKFLLRAVNIILKLFRKDNDALIIDTYLSKKIQLLLNLSFYQIPQLWENKEISYKKYNKATRAKFNFSFSKSDNQFTNLIKKSIIKFIPICYIESYKQIQNCLKKLNFPKKPKFIFTSTGYFDNEIVKFYIASSTEKGVKYFLGQHGNNYFTEKQSKLFPELKSCDHFITWGKIKNVSKKKYLAAFNFKTTEKKLSPKYGGNFTFFLKSGSDFQSQFFDGFSEVLKGYQDFLKIIKNLKSDVKKKVLLRLPHTHKNKKNLFIDEYFQKNELLNSINVDDFKISKEELFKRSSVHIHMYDSTGFLECVSFNYPTICYLPGGLKTIDNYAKKNYNNLIDHKVIFINPTKLAEHLNFLKLESNIEIWWNNKNLQKELKIFRDKFCIMSNNNSHKKIKKLILNNMN